MKGDFEDARRYSAKAMSEGTRDPRMLFHAAIVEAKTCDATAASLEALHRRFEEASTLARMLLPSEQALLQAAAAEAFAANKAAAAKADLLPTDLTAAAP